MKVGEDKEEDGRTVFVGNAMIQKIWENGQNTKGQTLGAFSQSVRHKARIEKSTAFLHIENKIGGIWSQNIYTPKYKIFSYRTNKRDIKFFIRLGWKD